jgi:hypothetical protein
MKIFSSFRSGPVLQITGAATLAIIALGLFVMSRDHRTQPPVVRVTKEMVSAIDRETDSLLGTCGIEKNWTRKRAIPIPGEAFDRIERRVAIPMSVLPVQVNALLNQMAKRYDGRAIASENLKENSVTIHIELHGVLVVTVVLKHDPTLKPARPDPLGIHT